MKFLANENFLFAGVKLLRQHGLDVLFIGEDAPSIKDWEVMEIAISTNRTILTHDRDYGELIFKYGYRPTAGVIYFRMKNYSPTEPALILLQYLSNTSFQFQSRLTVIDGANSFRQREIS
jgi:predicted nuclease of predicted toxin-antitoxin system